MVYVLDTSFCAALVLPDEESEIIESEFRKIQNGDTIYVPQLFWYEIANVLKTNVKRTRISNESAGHIIALIHSYNMTTDASLGELYTKKVLELAQEYDLSAYDAAYLELAMRKRAILGTLDKNLRRASALAKIPAII